MRILFVFIFLFLGCRYEPEFTIPEPNADATTKVNEEILLETSFENDADDWTYVPSHNRSSNKFLGERTNDFAAEGNFSLKIERITNSVQTSEGYYDYASWKKKITDFEIPFNADITFLAQLRLENVRGTGISLRINLKRNGNQAAFSESGWINGNGKVIEWQSYGCRFQGVRTDFDEIELEVRMEPVTGGAVYFDNASVSISY